MSMPCLRRLGGGEHPIHVHARLGEQLRRLPAQALRAFHERPLATRERDAAQAAEVAGRGGTGNAAPPCVEIDFVVATQFGISSRSPSHKALNAKLST